MTDGLLRGIGVLALVAAAITGAVLALFTGPVFDLLGFHPVAVEFMNGKVDRLRLLLFRWDDLSFTSDEIEHLVDVKALLGQLEWVFLGALVVAAAVAALRPAAFRAAARWAPAVFLAIGAAVVLAYFAFGFERVGVAFHQLVFPQGNWRFPWSSLIIHLYGTRVMVTGAAFVIGLAFGLLVAVAGLERAVGRRFR